MKLKRILDFFPSKVFKIMIHGALLNMSKVRIPGINFGKVLGRVVGAIPREFRKLC